MGVDGQRWGPHTAPPPASDAVGDRRGSTVLQQKQRAPALTATDAARQALSLYRQCVAAGQWARVTFEHRRDGEHVTFSSRPLAAAPAAARAQDVAKPFRRRRPNQRRIRKKKLWLQSRDQQQIRQQGPSCSQLQSRKAAPRVVDPSQQRELQATVAAAAARGSYAQAAAPAANSQRNAAAAAPAAPGAEGPAPRAGAPAAAAVAVAATSGGCSSPATPPRRTRASKRKKESSPGDTATIAQLDGACRSPPQSPLEPPSPEAIPRAGSSPRSPRAPSPQPYTTSSTHPPCRVTCSVCLAGCVPPWTLCPCPKGHYVCLACMRAQDTCSCPQCPENE